MIAVLEKKYQKAFSEYFPQYEKIVLDKLSSALTLEQLLRKFNLAFPSYESRQKWITHPDSLRDGKVTCDMAAVLIAIWWLQNGNNQSAVAEHACSRTEFDRHMVIGLVGTLHEISTHEISESYQLQRNERNVTLPENLEKMSLIWLHWLIDGGLQPLQRLENNRLTAPSNVNITMQSATSLAKRVIRGHKLP